MSLEKYEKQKLEDLTMNTFNDNITDTCLETSEIISPESADKFTEELSTMLGDLSVNLKQKNNNFINQPLTKTNKNKLPEKKEISHKQTNKYNNSYLLKSEKNISNKDINNIDYGDEIKNIKIDISKIIKIIKNNQDNNTLLNNNISENNTKINTHLQDSSTKIDTQLLDFSTKINDISEKINNLNIVINKNTENNEKVSMPANMNVYIDEILNKKLDSILEKINDKYKLTNIHLNTQPKKIVFAHSRPKQKINRQKNIENYNNFLL